MSHLVETMAYNRAEKPWHGLGKPVDNDMTVEEMQAESETDWEVGKYSTFARIGDKTVKTGMKALIRLSDNKVLSPSVGPEWEPTQNSEAFAFFKDFVEKGDMSMETAGSLREGKVVWVLAKIKESFELFGGDVVDSYMLFSNSHWYGKSTVIDYTPIRVVCNNTLTMALSRKSKNVVTVDHRAKFDPVKVKELMGIAHYRLDTYKEAAEFLGTHKAEEFDVVEYFKSTFPVHGDDPKKELSKNAKLCVEALGTQPGADFAKGTWWQAFNAVTYVTDHKLSRDSDARLYNAWFASARDRKLNALNLALDLAGKSKVVA